MSMKPKVREAPAAKPATPEASPRQDTAPEQGSENEISKLIVRWNYLEGRKSREAIITMVTTT